MDGGFRVLRWEGGEMLGWMVDGGGCSGFVWVVELGRSCQLAEFVWWLQWKVLVDVEGRCVCGCVCVCACLCVCDGKVWFGRTFGQVVEDGLL